MTINWDAHNAARLLGKIMDNTVCNRDIVENQRNRGENQTKHEEKMWKKTKTTKRMTMMTTMATMITTTMTTTTIKKLTMMTTLMTEVIIAMLRSQKWIFKWKIS